MNFSIKSTCLILTTLLFIASVTNAQESLFSKFGKLSCPEKWWVIKHLCIAKKAARISENVQREAEKIKNDTLLDGDADGGQVDAFRHAFWMASLINEISWRAAYSLGKAHEKGNKRDFKKRRKEDGNIPDYPGCQMDYLNNDIGLQIGQDHRDTTETGLIGIIVQEIRDGKLYKIKKDKTGNFIDCEGNVLKKEDYQGIWDNKKCIVKTNYYQQ